MKWGIFITFEGPDGAGKTTQIRYLTEHLQTMGMEVDITREPGGTPIGEQIREVLLNVDNRAMHPVTEAMLYAASRAQHVQQRIRPALQQGHAVLCDRFVDSSIAYQAVGRGMGVEQIMQINAAALDGIMPDVTICLLVTPEQSALRQQGKQLDRLELEDRLFKQRVYDGYMQLAKADPDRVTVLNADRPIEELAGQIREIIDRKLDQMG